MAKSNLAPAILFAKSSESFARSIADKAVDDLTAAELADAIGFNDIELKRAEKRAKELKDAARLRNQPRMVGEVFEINVAEQVAEKLDTDAVKVFLGHRLQAFLKEVRSTVVRIKAANT
jgi:hypothetical protein